MVKWTSPVISDASGQLAESVVFSRWKGRSYMRTYVKPANPKTDKQVANRDVFDKLVKRYQSLATDTNVKSAWNERALEYRISGFNLFMKFGRSSWIKISTYDLPSGTTYPIDITVTYKCGIPLSEARVYVFDGTTWTDITPSEGLSAEGSFTYTVSAAGTYEFFLATNKVLKIGDTSPQHYQAVTKWFPDETMLGAKEARLTAQR